MFPRIIAVFLGIGIAIAPAMAQVWEKPVIQGVTYRMEVDLATPLVKHVLRVNPMAPGVIATTEPAGGRLFAIEKNKGRETLSEMVARTGAVAALNADFFPFTADPLGAMIKDGRLISTPHPKRAVIGWGPTSSTVGLLSWTGKISSERGISLPLAGVNQEPGDNELVIYTDATTLAISKAPCQYLVAKVEDRTFGPVTQSLLKVVALAKDIESMPVEEGSVVLVARGNKMADLAMMDPGTTINLNWWTKGMDWSKVTNVIGGGPGLLNKGKVAIDWDSAGFKASFANSRHPRSAAGITADGDLILVAIDGRQSMSRGATLDELAKIMLEEGCVSAINLDGGGSTALNIFGMGVNRPSDGSERPVSNAILIMRPVSVNPVVATSAKLEMPSQMSIGSFVYLRVLDADGKPIDSAEVIFSAIGNAWIDQAGQLRGIAAGEATVSAFVRGQLITGKVTVTGVTAPAKQ